jgi:hypothetical protein
MEIYHQPALPPIVRLSLRRSQGRETFLAPCGSLLLDNFLLDRFKIGDALLFKGFGVYLTKNVLLKTWY